ncbi:MAG: MFS transporter [Candidatus Bathyarchaeia archaeon]
MAKNQSLMILIVFWFTWFWLAGARQIIFPLLPNMGEELSLDVAALSIVPTLVALGHSISSLLAGSLVKRIERRNMIILSLITVSLAQFLSTLINIYPLILVLTFISGLGFGIYLPSAISLLSEIVPLEKRDRYIGFHETAFAIASMIGPIFVGMVLQLGFGWRESIQLWIVFVSVALALQIKLVREKIGVQFFQGNSQSNESDKSLHDYWSPLHNFLFQASVICRNVGVSMSSLLPIYFTRQLGIDESTASFILGIASFTAVFGQAISGYLSEITGRFRLLQILSFLLFSSLIYIAISPFNLLLIIALSILAFAIHSFMPVALAFISYMTHPSERSKNIGVMMASIGVSAAFHTSIMGYLANDLGFSAAMFYSIGLSLIGFILLILLEFLMKRANKKSEK